MNNKLGLTKHLLGLLKDCLFAPSIETAKQKITVGFLEHILRRPILFQDAFDLEYLLYPGQNAQAYINNQGNYEIGETRMCQHHIRPGMVVLDVGANIGLYTLLFAKLVGPTGLVHSFEPDSKNYRRLKANIILNGFEEIVKANHLAVFSSSQMVKLNTFPDSVNSWHTLGNLELPDPWNASKTMSPTSFQEIQAISLDNYCAEKKINQIDFLKIDVEGAELEVLQGAAQTFNTGKIEAVMFEISIPQLQGMGHKPQEIHQFFIERDYVIYNILPDGSLSEYSRETALGRYQNFLATKKRE